MNKNFLNLVKENPTLPIVPYVDPYVIGDGDRRWIGSFGKAQIGEYAEFNERHYDDRDIFKEDFYNYYSDELDDKFMYNPMICETTVALKKYTKEELKLNNKQEKLLEKYLNEIADNYFKKAILVNVDVLS